jgi:hypothetical protein
MKHKTPQELGKELVESSAIAGAVKREAQSSLAVGYFTWDNIDNPKVKISDAQMWVVKRKEEVNELFKNQL